MLQLHFEQTAIGRIGIAAENGSITHLLFEKDSPPADAELCATPLLKEAFSQLHAWLAGERTEFSLPLAPKGTAFMRRAWQELCRIPYGRTASYREIAAAVGIPKGARAAGMACNRNPVPIFIPCHRVIGANGRLTGYDGGLELKEKLLALERSGCLPAKR
jgi:methylated-DNA-[protein]-cysteine S-methyltransferase